MMNALCIAFCCPLPANLCHVGRSQTVQVVELSTSESDKLTRGTVAEASVHRVRRGRASAGVLHDDALYAVEFRLPQDFDIAPQVPMNCSGPVNPAAQSGAMSQYAGGNRKPNRVWSGGAADHRAEKGDEVLLVRRESLELHRRHASTTGKFSG